MKRYALVIVAVCLAQNLVAQSPETIRSGDSAIRAESHGSSAELVLISTNSLHPLLHVQWDTPGAAGRLLTPTNLDGVTIEVDQKPHVTRSNGQWVIHFEPPIRASLETNASVVSKIGHANKVCELLGTNYTVHYTFDLGAVRMAESGPEFPAEIRVFKGLNPRASSPTVGVPFKGVYTHATNEVDVPVNWVKQALEDQ